MKISKSKILKLTIFNCKKYLWILKYEGEAVNLKNKRRVLIIFSTHVTIKKEH